MIIEPGELRLLQNEFGNHYLLVLRYDSESSTFLVKDFWDVGEDFSGTSSDDLYVRTHCKRVAAQLLMDSKLITKEILTGMDESEISQFLSIEEGLAKRKNRTLEMPELVQSAISQNEFEHAIELLSEWAMLDKYRSEIYLLRENCFRKLGRNAEADYELQVYQTLTGK